MGRKRIHFPKRCAICGVEYQPRKAGTLYCSHGCYGKARTGISRPSGVPAHTHRLSKTDAAWLAGLFDGEGSIVFVHKNRVTPTVRLTITNTCLPLLERVQEVTGVGAIIDHRQPTEKHAQTWYWQVYAANAHYLLRRMLPWLIVKRDKAESALVRQLPDGS